MIIIIGKIKTPAKNCEGYSFIFQIKLDYLNYVFILKRFKANYLLSTLNSTLLFCARPSDVLFGAMGCE